MEMYQAELAKALEKIDARNLPRDDYAFAMHYLEPEPDGGGMFTLRYQIDIENRKTGKTLSTLGGIGCDWVGDFDEALDEGYFDRAPRLP